MRIEGIIYLKNSITVKADCLGKEFAIKVAGFQGILAVPDLDPRSLDKNFDYSRFELMHPKGLNPKIVVENRWGVPFARVGDSSLEACAYWFEIESDGDSLDGTVKLVFDELGNWVELLKDNLTILSGQDLGSPRFGISQVLSDSKDKRDLYISNNIAVLNKYFPQQHITLNINQNIEVSSVQLIEAIDLTNEGKRPLLELQLLREAKNALTLKNLRRAILDSATAFELCLINTLKANLKLDEELKNEILKNYNSISKKRQLIKALKIDLPNFDYQNDLEAIRNKAIHVGQLPSIDEARKAFNIANSVVELLTKSKFEID